jgi:hypothetical protein
MVLFCTMTTQVSFSEMTLNDNVNIEGDVFLEGDELATLIDRTQSPLTLPEGHPFTNVKVFYWSSTAYIGDPGGGLRVELDQGFVHGCPSAIKNPIRAVRSGR